MNKTYIHGYDQRENIRLHAQASTLIDLLHSDTSFPADSRVLEVGCGVGTQTVTLAKNSLNAGIPRIYGAAKLVGRMENGLSLGFLQAMTSKEEAFC